LELEVLFELSEEELGKIDEIAPKGVAAGERYARPVIQSTR
jgi:hypothetical protein